ARCWGRRVEAELERTRLGTRLEPIVDQPAGSHDDRIRRQRSRSYHGAQSGRNDEDVRRRNAPKPEEQARAPPGHSRSSGKQPHALPPLETGRPKRVAGRCRDHFACPDEPPRTSFERARADAGNPREKAYLRFRASLDQRRSRALDFMNSRLPGYNERSVV